MNYLSAFLNDPSYDSQKRLEDQPTKSIKGVQPTLDAFPGSSLVELRHTLPGEKVVPIDPKFPPCPACHIARYWIAPTGKVVCGKCGLVRFTLTKIEFSTRQVTLFGDVVKE
jgi:hypothetical protein